MIAAADTLSALVAAVAERDLVAVRRLVLGPLPLPREVREEVLAVAALPAESFRVPVALWRYVYVQQQLLAQAPPPGDPSQLVLAIASPT
ncbi:MAG TPA: hypothetical protein VNW46_13880 [Gemmatimonadaceae bacterium]|jgi:hypothetical protein|nr:hypothetical protein [Gemmatimonadaceae bacterium]